MADLPTLAAGETSIPRIVQVLRQVVQRVMPTEDAATGALQAANNLDDLTNAATARSNLGVPAAPVANSDLANMAQSTIKGRAAGAGTGAPQDLSASQAIAVITSSQADAVSVNGNRWGVLPTVQTDGQMDIGQVLDFHNTDADSSDFDVRLWPNGTTTDLYVQPSGGSSSKVLTAATAGVVLQVRQSTYATNADLTVVIPNDDTTPTSSEGTQVISDSITPADNTNKVLVRVVVNAAVNTNSVAGIVALFRGTTCIDVKSHTFVTSNFPAVIVMEVLDSPASASSQTYSVRAGPSSNIMRLNGTTASRLFGGTAVSTMTLVEVSA